MADDATLVLNPKFWSRDREKGLTSAVRVTIIYDFLHLFRKVSMKNYICAKFHAIWSYFADLNLGGSFYPSP